MFRRGCWLEPIRDHHLPYLWAGYKRNIFENLEDFPPDLEPGQFKDRMVAYIVKLLELGHPVEIAYGEHERDRIPLGMIITFMEDTHATPHFFWLPEATLRNKMELTAKCLVLLKSQLLVLINTKEAAFFQHFAKYGILRRVGTIRDWSPGVSTTMFQSVSK